MAETPLTFELKLDTDAVVKDAQNLNKELNAIFKVTGDKQLSARLQGFSNTLEKNQYAAAKLVQKIEELRNEKVPTAEYQGLTETLNTLLDRYRKLDEASSKMDIESHSGYKAYVEAHEELFKMADEIDEVKSKIEQLKATGKDFTFADNEDEIEKLIVKLSLLNNSITKTVKSVYETDNGIAEAVYNSDELNSSLEGTANASNSIAGSIQEAEAAEEAFVEETLTANEELARFVATGLKINAITSILHGIKRAFVEIYNALKDVVSIMSKGIKKGATVFYNAIKTAASKMKFLNKETDRYELNLKKIVSQMLKYGLGIRSVFILWRKLRAYAQDALKLMAQQFTEIDEVVSNIINSFNQFKNSVGTAVQPLMTAFAPALELILDLLTRMNIALANFFAIFTGQKYIYKAKKSNDSYAESLNKVAKSAKEANKDIASYDKLLVINKNKGNGTGSGDGDADEVVDNFEKTIAESKFAEQLKDAMAKDDWEGVGELFAGKLNILVASLDNWLVNDFTPAASTWALRLANILNGFTGEFEWGDFGKTVSDGLNGITLALNNFLDTFDAKKFGAGIGTAVQKFIDNVNWENLATVFTGHWNNIFAGIQGFADEFDGKKFGEDLASFFNKAIEDFDWKGNLTAISDLVNDFLDGIVAFLENTDWDDVGQGVVDGFKSIEWNDIISKVFKAIGLAIGGLAHVIAIAVASAIEDAGISRDIEDATEAMGGDIVAGMLIGIVLALAHIGEWLIDNVFGPIFEGICDAFGIESPSKKMKEVGKNIIQGLLNGIKSLLKDIKEAVGKIVDAILGAFKTLKEDVVGVWNKISSGISWVVIKLWGKLVVGVGFIKDTVVGIFEKLKEKVVEIWGFIKDTITGTIDDIGTLIENRGELWGYIKGDVKKFFGIGSNGGSSAGGGGGFGVPHGASGMVIPPNKEFLAVFGDQRQGTNVEAPLTTIQEALANVLAAWDNRGNGQDIVLNLDGKTVARVVWNETEKRYKQTGARFA